MAYVSDKLLDDLHEIVLKILSSKKYYEDFMFRSPFSLISPNDDIIYSETEPFPRTQNLDNLIIEIKETVSDEKKEDRSLMFTEKEIIQMPKNIRKFFRLQGHAVHVRKRTGGRYKCSYEIRYAKKPYDKRPISVSATTLAEAKARFIEKLNNTIPQERTVPTIPTNFDAFSIFWFENFHKRKVGKETYEHNIKLFNRHIQKNFEQLKIKDINSVFLQRFLDNAPGSGKTAKDLHSLLKQIFDCAVKHGLIKLNPIGMCFIKNYEQEHGIAISIEDEKKLLNAFSGTPYEVYFAIALYTGLRPCEYTSAIIVGDFIKAENHKRKGGKIEYKRIPINPMLRPHLQGVTEIKMPKSRVLNNRLKKVLPNHKPYDMRTTFQTRCTECGINETAIGVFMGNSIGKLKEAYTDLSDTFLLNEAEKLKY